MYVCSFFVLPSPSLTYLFKHTLTITKLFNPLHPPHPGPRSSNSGFGLVLILILILIWLNNGARREEEIGVFDLIKR